jgi:hypothetical protein
MLISDLKSTEFSLIVFSCVGLQPVGILLPMALVHLLMHARWWGYLTSLGWAVAKEEGNNFIFSQ